MPNGLMYLVVKILISASIQVTLGVLAVLPQSPCHIYLPANKSIIIGKENLAKILYIFFFLPWCLGAGLNKLIESSLRQCAARSSLEPC